MTTKILFSGCSFVYGDGIENLHHNPKFFTNLMAEQLFGNDYTINNIGVSGHSNLRIFLESATELSNSHYDYAFIGWSSLHRLVFWLGLEEHECKRSFTPFTTSKELTDHHGHDIDWSSKELVKLKDKMLVLNNSHYEIDDLIKYVNTLIVLSESKGTKIFFVNNLLPWDENYFNHIKGEITPSMLTEYTNELLSSDTRDDDVITRLYHKMHNQYDNSGGINEKYWLNLYNSFYSMIVDLGTDYAHPGMKTQEIFADFLVKRFEDLKK